MSLENRRSGSGRPRRRFVLGTGILAVSLALTGCGADSSAEAGDVELNFVWWGDSVRATQTENALRIFEEKNPGITVTTEYQDSSPYQDKLATRFAGGNPPDLMAMPNRLLLEYAQRGALADLNEFSDVFSTELVPDSALSRSSVDGKLYGIAAGVTTIGMVVNKTITDEAGVTIPDDKTWTWADFAAFATEITEKTNGETYGTGYSVSTETNPILFARQKGEDFFTEDNKLGVSEETMQEWFQFPNDLRDDGGYPRAGFFEQQGSSAAESYLALGTVASQIIPINNYMSYNEAAGGNVVLLRMPGETESERRGYSADPSQLWSIAAESEHPVEAAKLLDFLINDEDGAAEVLTQRGVPVNTEVAESIVPLLGKDDKVFVDFMASIQEDELAPAYVYPLGASEVADSLEQLATEVEFGRLSPADAAKQFIETSNAAINE